MFVLLALACVKTVPDTGPGVLDSMAVTPVGELVQVSGKVFRFVDRELLEGARIDLVGVGIQTVSDANGGWSAQVPAGVDFVPTLELAQHLPSHHATFNLTLNEDRMYLQAVPIKVFSQMAAELAEGGVDLGTRGCILVNTVTVPAVDEMQTWRQFLELRPHGEPGVVMELVPKTHGSAPIYFDEQVRPDPTLTETTRDGGVLWLNIAPGTYTLRGTHPDPDLQVIERKVTCTDSEFINLNPPLGAGVRRR